MNQNEFRVVLNTMVATWPNLEEFFRKTADRDENTLALWFDFLEPLNLETTIEAIKMIGRGDVEVPFYSQLPATIRRLAREIEFDKRHQNAPSSNRREWRYDCRLCLDTGFVTVAAPFADQPIEIRNGTALEIAKPAPRLATCAVACHSCNAGLIKRSAAWSKSLRPALIKYDRERMFRIDFSQPWPDLVAAYFDFVARRRQALARPLPALPEPTLID